MMLIPIKKLITLSFILTLISGISTTPAFGQLHAPDSAFPPEYIKVTRERARKIVDDMDIDDPQKEARVKKLIARQYRDLSAIQDGRDARIKALKEKYKEEEADERAGELREKAQEKIDALHKEYIADLSAELTPEQVTQVKDGMTYGVVHFTYRGYVNLLPELTQEQKDQIMEYLVEAREYAMDAGSSEKKHAWFNEYKGKINNYLSSQGYNLKKAEERQKERNARKKDADNS